MLLHSPCTSKSLLFGWGHVDKNRNHVSWPSWTHTLVAGLKQLNPSWICRSEDKLYKGNSNKVKCARSPEFHSEGKALVTICMILMLNLCWEAQGSRHEKGPKRFHAIRLVPWRTLTFSSSAMPETVQASPRISTGLLSQVSKKPAKMTSDDNSCSSHVHFPKHKNRKRQLCIT